MGKLRGRLTFANVVSVIALFVALGGTGLAASQLGKNSVGTKQLKKNTVTTAKIKKEAVTAAKVKKGTLTGKQINASTLGTVPRSEEAAKAGEAANLSPGEAWHVVGASGEPGFLNAWRNTGIAGDETVAFYKDHEGIVHLRGVAIGGEGPDIFQLPPGFRPASEKVLSYSVICGGPGECLAGRGVLGIHGSTGGSETGAVAAPVNSTSLTLDGVTFRAES